MLTSSRSALGAVRFGFEQVAMVRDEKTTDIPAGPGEKGWQAHKSSNTRQQILDAAVHCIVNIGYARTTTMMIAQQAGLSRGATLHHFPSRNDIIAATVEYLFEKRTRAFVNSSRSLPSNEDRVRLAVRAYWAHANHPLFLAFIELSVAARHDDELRKILEPAQNKFDKEWYATAQQQFPEWQTDGEAFNLALTLSQTLIEGIAISHLMHPRENNEETLLEYLEQQIRELLPG
ncbi:MAG: TetR/AcrR family transcriptional regulator [Gammaproteobacteria bacterium]